MAERQYVGETPTVGAPEVNQVADPAALGLGAFALTTFLLSLTNANLLKAGDGIALPAAFLYGGITQLLAGMWEFRNNRNTFGATAFSSYGAFWLTFYWLVTHIDSLTGSAADNRVAIGAYLLATFAVLSIGEFADASGITKFGGWLGIITAFLAWYLAAAVVINHTFKRTVLPVWPVGGT